jgi:hypothetical protein
MRLAPLVPTPRPKPSAPVVQRKPKPTLVSPPREAEDESEDASELRESDVVGGVWSSAGGSDSPRAPQGESSAWRGGVSTKLRVGKSDDPLEREADAIADRIMRMPAAEWSMEPSTLSASPAHEQLRRACCSSCTTCDEEDDPIMREPAAGQRGGIASEDFSGRVRGQLGRGGRTLSAYARNFLEPRLGLDLGGIRLHVGTEAGSLSQQIHARAFTLGQHIFFAPGELRPETSEGMRLLAHEVAHTLQGRRTGELHRAPPEHRLEIDHDADDPLAGIDDEPEGEPEPYEPLDDSFLAAERRKLATADDPEVIAKLEQLVALGEALDAARRARAAHDEKELDRRRGEAAKLVETMTSTPAIDWHDDGLALWTGDYTHGVFVRMVELGKLDALGFRDWTEAAESRDTRLVDAAFGRTMKYLEDQGMTERLAEIEKLDKREDKARALRPIAEERANTVGDADAVRDLRIIEDEYFGLNVDYQTDLNMWGWTLDRLMELAESGDLYDAQVALDLALKVIDMLTATQRKLAEELGPHGLRLGIERRAQTPDEDSDAVGYLRNLQAMVTRAVIASQVAAETCMKAAMRLDPNADDLMKQVESLRGILALDTLSEGLRLVPLAGLRVTVVAEFQSFAKSELPAQMRPQFHAGQKEGDVIVDYHRNVETVDHADVDLDDAILYYAFDPVMQQGGGAPSLTQTVQEMIDIRDKQIAFIRDQVMGRVGEQTRDSLASEGTDEFSPGSLEWMEVAVVHFFENERRKRSEAKAFEKTIGFLEHYLSAFTVHPQQNIWERDRYLSRTFPRALAGQLVHDCGVYALRIAYMLSTLQAQLGLNFHLAMLPDHLALIITSKEIGAFAVNNDKITKISDGDIQLALPPGAKEDAELANPSDAFLGEIAAKAYQPGANMPYLIFDVPPGTSAKDLEDLYLHVINQKKLFGNGSRVQVGRIGGGGMETVDLALEYLAVGGQTAEVEKQIRRLRETGLPCSWKLLEGLTWDVKQGKNRKKQAITKLLRVIVDHGIGGSADPIQHVEDEQLEAKLPGVREAVQVIMTHCVTRIDVESERDRLTKRRTRINTALAGNPDAPAPGVGVSQNNLNVDDTPFAAVDAELAQLQHAVKELVD